MIWDYHLMGHELRACSAGIGLGSHDIGVAVWAAELYRRGLFEVLVFSGGNSPTTVEAFPRGEAVHYRERAMELGVPDEAIIVEPDASNTGENIAFSRALLEGRGIGVGSVLLVSKPYMERRSYATVRRMWPEVEVVSASQPLTFGEYVEAIGDERFVIDMVVGDLQRVVEYPARGFAIEQEVPAGVHAAYRRLVAAGYDSRIVSGGGEGTRRGGGTSARA
ncbi:YdcF family protein [Spirillospora sp. NPDC047279]|uniref:YdcF family protein n=1 Tax=Spirillospora sp. NPDC047279 TaxID=3155478 RepID=UPI0033C63E44